MDLFRDLIKLKSRGASTDALFLIAAYYKWYYVGNIGVCSVTPPSTLAMVFYFPTLLYTGVAVVVGGGPAFKYYYGINYI